MCYLNVKRPDDPERLQPGDKTAQNIPRKAEREILSPPEISPSALPIAPKQDGRSTKYRPSISHQDG